jgi:hypothetical protein
MNRSHFQSFRNGFSAKYIFKVVFSIVRRSKENTAYPSASGTKHWQGSCALKHKLIGSLFSCMIPAIALACLGTIDCGIAIADNDVLPDGSVFCIKMPNATCQSDGNWITGFSPAAKTPFQLALPERKEIDLAQWRALRFDVHSVELPLDIQFDENTLELRVKAGNGKTAMPNGIESSRRITPMTNVHEVLQEDFLGHKHNPQFIEVGPIVDLPLDGTPVRVDPRKTI